MLPHREESCRPIILRSFVALHAALLTAAAAAQTPPALQQPAAKEILADLKPGHPRLVCTDQRIDELREQLRTDETLKRWHAELTAEAERVLDQPPSEYVIPDGKRLLATSRRVLGRVVLLSLLYRTDGDQRYVDRTWRELEAAAAFKDWNPSHFLDTAEMTHAFAIGYDWLYREWTPDQRRVLREAIVEMGLTPGLKSYRGEARYGWWHKSQHNWNQVCNGGMTVGALAIADEEPELCGEILESAIKSVPLAMQHYAPDGAWAEGPGYWSYATQYNVAMLAAMESALGTDYGLAQIPGFSEAGVFPPYVTGATGITFNFADAGAGPLRPWPLFWFSRKFDRPDLAAYEIAMAKPDAGDLIFYDPRGHAADWTRRPLDKHFRTAEVGSFRSAWNDPDALFVGFKAGRNPVNHSHLDLGTFVLEALGERWLVDLGSDNYNLPGYFGGNRWNFYRLRAEGHNTLVINPASGPDQDPRASTQIVAFQGGGDSPRARLDLTPAYAAHASKVMRTISMPGRRRVVIHDEIECPQPAEIWSFLHTPAEADLAEGGRSATLAIGGRTLAVELVTPPAARLEVLPAEPLPTSPDPEGQKENHGIRKLAVHLDKVSQATIEIHFTPAWPDGS